MFYSFTPSAVRKKKINVLADIKKRFSVEKEMEGASHMFIFHDPKLQMYGGTFLNHQPLTAILPPHIRTDIHKPVWIMAPLFLTMENEDIVEAIHHFDWHYENFFTSLYEQLVNFSICREIKEVFTCLSPHEQEDLLLFGKWPFEWEIGLPGGKVLGCLSLGPGSYERFKEKWRNSH